jgi:YHS domain-containing protein
MMTRRDCVLWLPWVALGLGGCRSAPTDGSVLAASDPVHPAFKTCAHSCGLRSARDRAEARAQPGVGVGEATHCPVSGAVFRVREQSPRRVVNGKTFYFCCESCAAWFSEHEAEVMARRGLG